jgi:hypothetical protein
LVVAANALEQDAYVESIMDGLSEADPREKATGRSFGDGPAARRHRNRETNPISGFVRNPPSMNRAILYARSGTCIGALRLAFPARSICRYSRHNLMQAKPILAT